MKKFDGFFICRLFELLFFALCIHSLTVLNFSVAGKTQCINHFRINNSWYLVDLPGYGYDCDLLLYKLNRAMKTASDTLFHTPYDWSILKKLNTFASLIDNVLNKVLAFLKLTRSHDVCLKEYVASISLLLCS